MARSSTYRIIAVLAPIIVLALASFWFLEVVRRGHPDSGPTQARTAPDFYVEQFNYIKLAREGNARYHLSGERLTHHPVDDSYNVTMPVVRNIRPASEPMVITAQRAWINSDSSEVHLFDDVQIDRPASATAVAMDLTTEKLIVFPDEDVMQTDLPVRINHGRSVLTGVGMNANNATGEFKLHRRVQSTFRPAQK